MYTSKGELRHYQRGPSQKEVFHAGLVIRPNPTATFYWQTVRSDVDKHTGVIAASDPVFAGWTYR